MRNKIIISVAIIAVAISSFTSCNKENPISKPPVIKNLELGIKNSHEAYIGADIHIEAEIEAENKIDKITVEIHQNKNGGTEIKKVYTEFSGQRNTNFHKHLDIPKDAKEGEYHLHFTVTDLSGNQTDIEETIKIKKINDTEAPVITISNAPENGKTFSKGETISISGTIKDNNALGGLLISLVKESDNIADKDVTGRNKSVIIMLHTHDFDSANSHNFSASIVVGAENDNNMNPAPITGQNQWREGNYYILVKSKDAMGNSAISKRYPIILNIN